jgi:hypothetical protein
MRNRLLYTLTFFLTVIFVNGQTKDDDKMYYSRLEGNIGTDINVTANIVRLFDQLTGNYQYRFIEDGDRMYFGKTIEVSGEINENDSALLKEFGRSEYAFQGIMKKGKYTGTWNAPDNKKLSFNLTEYYPNGSMEFDVHYLRSEGQLVDNESDSPSAEIELTLIFPDDTYVNPTVTDSVKKFIAKGFFGAGFNVNKPDSMLVGFENEYLFNYKKQNENWHQKGSSFNWEKVISMSVIYNTNYMLCLEYIKYAYSGGAHGMTNISYDIIYLDDGQLLTYSEVFKDDSDEALADLLTDQLRRDYSIPETINLKEAGFFVEKVNPNRNIYVNGSGVGFLYNSYEIAPYSQGATNIFLRWSQIKDLVKMGTPVYRMSQR